MATILTHPEPTLITRKLAILRRQVYALLALRGTAMVWLYVLGLAAVDLALDWQMRFDRVQRGLILALAVAFLAVAIYRRIIRPLTRPLGDDELCLRVEAAYPQLRQSVISAYQFARLESELPRQGVSPEMVRAAVREGIRHAQQVDFSRAIGESFRRQVRRLVLAAGIGAAGVVILWLTPVTQAVMQRWFERNVLLREIAWWQRTHLHLDETGGNALILPRGDDWEVIVRAQGQVPAEVTMDIRFETLGSTSQDLAQIDDTRFRGSLRNVLEPFSFRLRGGDEVTHWYPVRLIERPHVASLALRVEYPAYTQRPPTDLPTDQGSYDLLKGSRLSITGRASQALRSAELRRDDKPLQTYTATTQPATAPAPEGFVFTLTPEQLVSGMYSLSLVDADGLASRQPTRLTLRVQPDRKPEVRARLVGITGLVSTRAMIPIQCRVSDDYSVTAAELTVSTTTGETTTPARTLPMPELAELLPAREATAVSTLDLLPWKLTAGTTVSFKVEVKDNDTVSGPNLGQSPAFFVRVVTDAELRTELLRREQEQRQEFERLIKEQDETQTDVRALVAELARQPRLTDAQRQTLVRWQKRQKLLADRTVAVAERFNDILAEVRNNRLEEETGPGVRRLRDEIIAPLRKVAAGALTRAAETLDQARGPNVPPADRDAALALTLRHQQDAMLAMRQILRAMEKHQGYQEALNLLYEILKAQTDVNEATIRELKRSIFGDAP